MIMTANREVITGGDFRRMMAGAYSEFLLEYDNIDQLSGSFSGGEERPGTDVMRTVGAAAVVLADAQDEGIGGLAKRAANGAVLGARGSLGVIVSQLLRGLAKGLGGKYEASSSVFGKAFQYGILYAQRTGSTEHEWPIITVARAAAKGAYHAVRENLPISEILAAAIEAGDQAEKMLVAGNTVDAGARTLLIFLRGCLHGLAGSFVSPTLSLSTGFKTTYTLPDPKKDLICAYCLVFSVQGTKTEVADVERVLKKYGTLVIVRKSGTGMQLHLHTDHPGLVVEQALGWGSLGKITLQNIAEPHESLPMDKAPVATAVLAVAADEEEADLLEDRGASVIIIGGAGCSPAVGDFVNAVHSDFAEKYILLPNGPGLHLVLRQARWLVGNRVAIIDCSDKAARDRALAVYQPERSFAENCRRMSEARAK